jgi:glycosyltransferase involved in cell wall biosynthesis
VDDFSVALVGPYPPPYGGVSVHIKRLHGRLQDLAIPSRVYCQPLPASGREGSIIPVSIRFSWKVWLPEHGWRCDSSIVHFHDGWYWTPAALAMLWRGKQVVMTFHDQQAGGVKWEDASWLERWLGRRLFRHPRVRWVAVSEEVERQLIEKGVLRARIVVIPAYIPPRSGVGARRLPRHVEDFLGAHRPILSTYAWKLTVDEQGVDVYGFDLCLEAIRSLKAEHPGIGLVISLPQVSDLRYFQALTRRIAELEIEKQVLFFTEPLEDVHLLWQASDVFLRATNTDGDAVTVREALSMGVPVVASDASRRPEGAVLFESRNAVALTAAVRRVLADRQTHVRSLGSIQIDDNFPALLNLYRGIPQSAQLRGDSMTKDGP